MGKQSQSPTKVEQLLAYFTHKIIAKYHPMVIGITGSVGKTSTRHAIAAALSSKYQLREPQKNYNNLIGIPLTVIGAKGIDESTNQISIWFGWIRIFTKALTVWLLPHNYPKLLVLEYGIDHPGDMDALLNVVQPNIAVLTSIGVSHLENFSSQEELANEKGKIASRLKTNELFVFNGDDPLVSNQAQNINVEKISYGHSTNVTVILKSIQEYLHLNPYTVLDIQTPTRNLELTIPVVGTAHTSAVLAAVALAEGLEVESDLIKKGLSGYKAMPGRLNVLAGIKKTILIDDTYNAAPVSTKEALNLLGRFSPTSKIAVLGDMLELGDASETSHADIGKIAAGLNLRKLVTVGELGKEIAESALANGMKSEDVISFGSSDEAGKKVLEILTPESVVLIKGSQGVRMEKITKELLAEPTAAGHLLVRQYGKWIG
jgi:UDP-N-acetylmuramoyl-tripeptide--D-alanyl-D-alanine ligase